MSYITLALPFNVDGVVGERLISTAWLFKIASHKMIGLANNFLFYLLPTLDGKIPLGRQSTR